MKNHKLFLILSHLTTSEQKDLEKFLQSPLFNNRKLALQLFQFLKNQKGIPSKAVIFKQLFPKEKYNDVKLRLCMSHLVKKIEAFLVYQYRQQQKVENTKILSTIYQHKKLPKNSEQVLKNTLALQEKQPLRNGQYYFDKYQIALERFDYATTIRTTSQNLQEVSDSLDTSFLILKLQQACSSVSHQAVYQQQYQLGLLQVILPYIEQQRLTSIPAIGLYYYCYLALTGNKVSENFKQFKKLLFDYRKLFPTKEWSNLFLFGINICIKIINSGDHSYLKEILELYKAGLNSEALLENGRITRFTYQNIVTAGMRTNELAWTRNFIITYKDSIEKKYQESAYRFNMARLAYFQKKYDEALELLQDVAQKDMLINLYSKGLLLKIYYELEEFKLLDSFLDAFQIYLRRKKVIPLHKENYRSLIYFTQKLMRINPYAAVEKKALKSQIEQKETLLEREWLLAQLAKLD